MLGSGDVRTLSSADVPEPSLEPVSTYLLELQGRISVALEAEETGAARFVERHFEANEGGLARPRMLEGGEVLAKAAVLFTHSIGSRLPAAVADRRPELEGGGFEVASLSLIVHPRNPYAPTSHMFLRCFITARKGGAPTWWFGGGFDLTPCYGFREDAIHWHRTARDACQPHGADLYPRLKKTCDEYFYLQHRGEARGVGGLFFDDYDEGGFEESFAFARSVGDHFLPAYLPILRRRRDTPYGDREREFQLYRRGRYVEFNLVYDRGTRYGLQSGRRVESVLASMPPLAAWRHDWQAEPGTPEATLSEEFLKPRDWLAEAGI